VADLGDRKDSPSTNAPFTPLRQAQELQSKQNLAPNSASSAPMPQFGT